MKQEKYSLIYDEEDLIEEEIKFRFEEDNEGKKTLEEIRQSVYNSGCDFLSDRWEDFKESLTEYIKEIDKTKEFVFKIKAKNMGWRNLNGFKILNAKDGETLLDGILPKTNEFSLYVKKSKTQMVIKCYHHDAPMGETYFIKPLNKKEFKEYIKEENHY